MTWAADLRRVTIGGRQLIGASFRGVAFFVDTAERGGGRRAVVHEFPLRDDPFVEDLGRRARTFRVDGYVLGDDYLAQRDALLSQLEDVSGPGELVHPYHGVRRAICISVSVRESRSEGGFAAFSIEFAEAPAQALTPTEVKDAPVLVAAAADVAATATVAELEDEFDITTLPAFALTSAEDALGEAAAALGQALGPVIQGAQELAEFTGRIALITTQLTSLVRAPGDAVTALRAAITGLVDTASAAPEAFFAALLEAAGVDMGPEVEATTATRAREAANQTALIAALRRTLAIEAARIAPVVPFQTIDDATAARDQVAAILEAEAATAGDIAYPALVDLRSELLRAVPGGQAFARVVTVTRSSPIPSLLLTYQLYGSVDLEADVIGRNAVAHPGFLAGDLKVLSDG